MHIRPGDRNGRWPLIIYLVRHGQTVWNLEKRRQGQLDSPLTEAGVEQARAVGRLLRVRIESNASMVSSPLGRALQTAELVACELGLELADIRQDPQLMEADHGAWSGLVKEQIKPNYPEQWRQRHADRWNFRFPGGESYADLALRAASWLESLESSEQPLVVVTHEMLSRCLRGHYLGLDSEQTLQLSHPHDHVFIMANGTIETSAPELNLESET